MKIKKLLTGLLLGTLLITSISNASPLDKFANKTKTVAQKTIKVSVPFDYMFFLVPQNVANSNLMGVFLFNQMKKNNKRTNNYILVSTSL